MIGSLSPGSVSRAVGRASRPAPSSPGPGRFAGLLLAFVRALLSSRAQDDVLVELARDLGLSVVDDLPGAILVLDHLENAALGLVDRDRLLREASAGDLLGGVGVGVVEALLDPGGLFGGSRPRRSRRPRRRSRRPRRRSHQRARDALAGKREPRSVSVLRDQEQDRMPIWPSPARSGNCSAARRRGTRSAAYATRRSWRQRRNARSAGRSAACRSGTSSSSPATDAIIIVHDIGKGTAALTKWIASTRPAAPTRQTWREQPPSCGRSAHLAGQALPSVEGSRGFQTTAAFPAHAHPTRRSSRPANRVVIPNPLGYPPA